MHTKLKTVMKSTSSYIWSDLKLNFFSLQNSNVDIFASSWQIKTTSPPNDFIIQDSSLSSRDSCVITWTAECNEPTSILEKLCGETLRDSIWKSFHFFGLNSFLENWYWSLNCVRNSVYTLTILWPYTVCEPLVGWPAMPSSIRLKCYIWY